MILLDTNALIWLEQGHPRVRSLAPRAWDVYVSPASVLELQFLADTGRVRLRTASARTLADEGPWQVDDPPAARWFAEACDFSWTRDPFDRLIVAHAQLRGWKLATSDEALWKRLPPSRVIRV